MPLRNRDASMKEYLSASIIDAPPERVWAILTDASAYASWNPEIMKIDGRIGLGERIRAHVRLGDGAVRPVTQRITALEPPMRMQWVGGLPLGLFVGQRTFTLTPTANATEFR